MAGEPLREGLIAAQSISEKNSFKLEKVRIMKSESLERYKS